MAIEPNVGPTVLEPTHDIQLTDLANKTLGLVLVNSRGEPDKTAFQKYPIPRQVTRMNTGASSGYESLEAPYTPIVQQDWSGGRGQEEFEQDTSRYYDANTTGLAGRYPADTVLGDVICSPLPTNAPWGINGGTPGYTNFHDTGLAEITNSYATSFVAASSGMLRAVQVVLTELDGDATFHVEIYSDNGANAPLASLALGSYRLGSGAITIPTVVSVPVLCSLTGGTKYWLVIWNAGSIVGDMQFGYSTPVPGSVVLEKNPGWGVLYNNAALSFSLSTEYKGKSVFFEYKGALYQFNSADDGTAPRLFMNGYRGTATANTNTLFNLNTDVNMTTWGNLAGKIIELTAGPGSEEFVNYRTIVSNTNLANGNTISVSPPWNIAHTTATEFVIKECNTWQEITGHGVAKPPTDVLVVDDIVYVAQGKSTKVRRLKGETSAGVWKQFTTADGLSADENGVTDGKNTYADKLLLCPATDGTWRVWAFLSEASTGWCSERKTWGNDLAFTRPTGLDAKYPWPIQIGITGSRIVGVTEYDDPSKPYIQKEDEIGSISNYVYARIHLDAIKVLRSRANGMAAMTRDVYWYFNLGQHLERYYDQRLDDIGVNREAGLPSLRKGNVTAMLDYPGGFYMAIDAGEDGYSSIWKHNGVGWHELYRSPLNGRIRSMYIQNIPGREYQRLWFSLNETTYWLPVSHNPRKTTGYTYQTGSQIVTSWMFGGLKDVLKFWSSVTIFSENLLRTGAGTVPDPYVYHRCITVECQVDNATDADVWTNVGTIYSSPVQELDISSLDNISGRRIRFRLTLYTDDNTQTPRMIALVANPITRVPPKYGWSFTFDVSDNPTDLVGDVELEKTVDTINAILEDWASSTTEPCPLTLTSNLAIFNAKKVMMEPASYRPVRVVYQNLADGSRRIRMVGSMTLIEA